MSHTVADQLRLLGQRGILITAAERGDIKEMACTMHECLCPQGRDHFERKSHPPTDWAPSVDHYPILKKDGGKLVLGNVRLAHRLCNRVDYAKKHGINHAKDRSKGRRMAQELPSGSPPEAQRR
jgi:hypothetical protein